MIDLFFRADPDISGATRARENVISSFPSLSLSLSLSDIIIIIISHSSKANDVTSQSEDDDDEGSSMCGRPLARGR